MPIIAPNSSRPEGHTPSSKRNRFIAHNSVILAIFVFIMKTITVVAAVIRNSKGEIFATQRGYGEYKDWWEVPGGKAEPGETMEQALRREIMEELDTEISVDSFITTIDYDYPAFHLTMHCYWCSILSGNLELREHEAAKWLAPDELESVNWLPADRLLLPLLSKNPTSK